MALSALVENGIAGANALVPNSGMKIRTWATSAANAANLPADADLTLPAAVAAAKASSIRGVLLGYLAFGGRKKGDVATFRDLIKGWENADLKAELKAYQDFSQAQKQGVILMPSFRYTNSLEKQNAKSVLETARTVMMKAYLAAVFGNGRQGGQPECKEYAQMKEWFGQDGNLPAPVNRRRYAVLIGNLKSLTDVLGTKPIRVYYRGKKIKGPSDKPNEHDAAEELGDAYGSAFRLSSIPAEYDKTYSHLTLGTPFFKTGAMDAAARKDAGEPELRPAGTLVHELSHNICDTQDVEMPPASFAAHPDWQKEDGHGAKAYFEEKCHWLAQNAPELAINNADSYDFYFESFKAA